jgi:hypothetical protein
MDSESKLGWVLGYIFSIALMVWASYGIVSEKYTKAYSLGSGSSTSDGGMYLIREVENWPDDRIPINGITFQQAVALVDSLNRTLAPHQK